LVYLPPPIPSQMRGGNRRRSGLCLRSFPRALKTSQV